MNADLLWDIIKWLSIPVVGAILVFIFRMKDDIKQQIDDQFDEHEKNIDLRISDMRDRQDEHFERDEAFHKATSAELDAIRKQATAFQVEAVARFVSRDESKESTDRIQQSLGRIEDDIRMLTDHLLRGRAHDPHR